MPYVLGIDIGNTTTAAAVSRRRDTTWTRPEAVALGVGSVTVPSVLHLTADGTFTVGEPGTGDGCRTARDFVRRVGDDVPLLLAGEACPPQTLAAVLATWVVERTVDREGGPAQAVVISHPAGWGRYRRQLLHRALWELGLGDVTLLPRTVTVAESHAVRGFAGTRAAVYALGGNTFEAALVRRNPRGTYETFGLPQALECFGGVDFDEALAEHVRSTLSRELATAPRETDAALRGLLPECDRAKRELTVAVETDVVLTLPTGPVRVPVSRVRFEDMIRPAVQATVDLLVRTVHSAGLTPEQLDGVLLAGGSTRIPLIAELLVGAFPVPVEVEPDPQLTAATGAALAACQVVSPRPGRPEPAGEPHPDGEPVREPEAATGVARVAAAVATPRRSARHRPLRSEPPPRPPVRFTPLELPKASRLALARGRGREG
ncbi:Hsp70 family protein [Micromonospora phytophila]|uniref:Hsp70 family protein n=1 Tax=Micromonospora phytophila TaxID=709888 RepID=UPI00202F336E|nr:Hsp70 family protein [Micromonospora phytophila]MCM0677385.1 Hsp70 family protein [Micromonospora phytophila]